METTDSKSQYLEHLNHFNQHKGQVTLYSDIKNNKGVLLAAKGEKLSDKNIDLMIRHKLAKTLDSCIGLTPFFNAKLLKKKLEELLEKHQDITAVVRTSGANQTILSCLIHIEQYPQIYQKLTLLSHALPQQFERSLLNSALSLSLALFANTAKSDCIRIFLISLIENIGLLHIKHELTETGLPPFHQWRTYHAHPLIAKEFLKSISGFPHSIIRGVAEHHERIDGTGFPIMTQGEALSPFVTYTGIADELTRLKYAREHTKQINLAEALQMMQFRRQHFPSQIYANLQTMILKSNIHTESTIHHDEMQSFARLQLFYYCQCIIYCDIVARIADSISSTAPTHCRSLIRLQTLSKNFILGVFASGMLSQPIRQLIEECIEKNNTELLDDLVNIDHAHHGILDQIKEIFLFLEYTVTHEKLSDKDKTSEAFHSLQACYALLKHMRKMKNMSSGWTALIQEMYNGNNDLSAIIESMKQ